MNIVCFPSCENMSILGEILKGGFDKVKEAGALLVGGHTVDDKEPKYGLSVSGLVHPDKVLSNAGAKVGDVLVITKPVGTGIINTAIKADIADKSVEDEAIKIMTHLNKYAAIAFDEVDVNSVTDITGFGLLGHTLEMAKASDVCIEINSNEVPIINSTIDFAKMGIIPEGMYKNMSYMSDDVESEGIEQHIMDILYDPQTSGGLLVSVEKEKADELINKMIENGSIEAKIIGNVVKKEGKHIKVK